MFSIRLSMALFVSLLLASCSAPSIIDQEGRSFELSVDGLECIVRLSQKEDKLSGFGGIIYTDDFKPYKVEVSGLLGADSSAEVSLVLKEPRTGQIIGSVKENWRFSSGKILVENVDIRRAEPLGKVVYNEINGERSKKEGLYDRFLGYKEGYAVVGMGKGDNVKFGLIDANNKFTIPIEFTNITKPNEGTVVVTHASSALNGLYDVKGKELLEPRYDKLAPSSNGLVAFMDRGYWGFLDLKGNVIVSATYLYVGYDELFPYALPFNDGLALVQNRNQKFQFMSTDGKIAIEKEFDYAAPFKKGEAMIIQDGKTFFIDTSGTCVRDCPQY
jgi:hypothetical protein